MIVNLKKIRDCLNLKKMDKEKKLINTIVLLFKGKTAQASIDVLCKVINEIKNKAIVECSRR